MNHSPRTVICTTCGLVLVDNWNLAPIGATKDNLHRVYAENVHLCDGCYDVWATNWDIEPLEGE